MSPDVAPIPRLALTREQAAAAMSTSLDIFERHVAAVDPPHPSRPDAARSRQRTRALVRGERRAHTHQEERSMRDPAELQAMEKLYNEAIDSSVTKHAADFMFRAHLLLRISDQDVEAAKDVIHIDAGREAAWREFQGLSEDERKIIGDEVGYQFSRLVKRAITSSGMPARYCRWTPPRSTPSTSRSSPRPCSAPRPKRRTDGPSPPAPTARSGGRTQTLRLRKSRRPRGADHQNRA